MVDGGGLENRCTRKGIGGSNPSPSATRALRVCLGGRGPQASRGEQARRDLARIPLPRYVRRGTARSPTTLRSSGLLVRSTPAVRTARAFPALPRPRRRCARRDYSFAGLGQLAAISHSLSSTRFARRGCSFRSTPAVRTGRAFSALPRPRRRCARRDYSFAGLGQLAAISHSLSLQPASLVDATHT